MNFGGKQIIKKTIKFLFVFIIFAFLGKYIFQNVTQLKEVNFEFNYLLLFLSLLICCLFLLFQYFLWHFITKVNNCNIGLIKTLYSKGLSNFGKYIPGKIFGYAILFTAYSEEKISKREISICMFIDLVASLLGSLFVVIFSILFIETPLKREVYLISIISLLFLGIIIHPSILNFFSKVFFRKIKLNPPAIKFSYFKILKFIFLFSINWLLFALSFFVFINAFIPLSFQSFFFTTAAVVISGLIGFVAIFVPAGLGVREGVLSVSLAMVIPEFFAGIISLASRIWLTIGEIIVFGIVFLIYKINNGLFVKFRNRTSPHNTIKNS